MPEPLFEVPLRTIAGDWDAALVTGPGALRLTPDAVELMLGNGGQVRIAYGSLSGAGWRTGRLAIHGRSGQLVMEAKDGLDRAWVVLVRHACPVPEFTRGLRTLGSARGGGGHHEGQARFFAPLLQARRRLEDEPDLDGRVVAFDASALRDRVLQVLRALAAEAYPSSAADRRAIEAELLDAVEPLLVRLRSLERLAKAWPEADESVRLDVWRSWVESVKAVFMDADHCWSAASRILPPALAGRGPRRWWSGTGALVALSLGVALGGVP